MKIVNSKYNLPDPIPTLLEEATITLNRTDVVALKKWIGWVSLNFIGVEGTTIQCANNMVHVSPAFTDLEKTSLENIHEVCYNLMQREQSL